MISHERVVSISTLTRLIGWAIFLLLAVSLFDFTLLSKHSLAGSNNLRNTAVEPALPVDSSSLHKSRLTDYPRTNAFTEIQGKA